MASLIDRDAAAEAPAHAAVAMFAITSPVLALIAHLFIRGSVYQSAIIGALGGIGAAAIYVEQLRSSDRNSTVERSSLTRLFLVFDVALIVVGVCAAFAGAFAGSGAIIGIGAAITCLGVVLLATSELTRRRGFSSPPDGR